jgi:DnaJ-class molecular chaperone
MGGNGVSLPCLRCDGRATEKGRNEPCRRCKGTGKINTNHEKALLEMVEAMAARHVQAAL